MDESRNLSSTSDLLLPIDDNVSEKTLVLAALIAAVAVVSLILCFYCCVLLLSRHRHRAKQHLSSDVEELDTSEDRQFIPSKKTRDDIGLPEQNPGLLDASKLSENADIRPVNDFHPVRAVEDRSYIQHRFSAFYLGIDEKAGLYLRKQPDDHPDNAVMTMAQYFGYDSGLQTGVRVNVIHKGSTCVCADDQDLVDNLSLMQHEADLNAKELNIDVDRIFFRTHVVEEKYVCFESTYKEGHFLVADKDTGVRLIETDTTDIKTHFRLRQH